MAEEPHDVVLYVDMPALKPIVERADNWLTGFTKREKIRNLAVFVNGECGGLRQDMEQRTASAVGEIVQERGSNVVPLHLVIEKKVGVCCHRTLLFKILCDHVDPQNKIHSRAHDTEARTAHQPISPSAHQPISPSAHQPISPHITSFL